jgi:hypothetical protein
MLVMDAMVVYEMHRRTAARFNQSIGEIYQTFRASDRAPLPLWLNAAAVISIIITVMYVGYHEPAAIRQVQ